MATDNYGWFSGSFIGMSRSTSLENDLQIPDRSAVVQDIYDEDAIEKASDSPVGPYERPGLALSPVTKNYGWFSTNYLADFVFERIWVQPLLFALEFITEDSTDDLKIWNAYRRQDTSITSVVVTNQDGTLLVYPALSHTIAKFGDTTYTLNIYATGPPLQDTEYKLTIGGIEFTVEITGVRIIPFDLDPNWDADLEIAYEFNTTIYSNEELYEQRRALTKESWLNIKASYDTSGLKSRRHHNSIIYGHDKVFGVPIYHEKMIPTSVPQSGSIITVAEDFTYYYNLNNRSDYVIIVDHMNELSEIKEVSALNAGLKQITVVQPISESFDVSTTFIYPCSFCIIKSFRGNMQTDKFDALMLNFREYKSG